jgi:hypothetical protein
MISENQPFFDDFEISIRTNLFLNKLTFNPIHIIIINYILTSFNKSQSILLVSLSVLAKITFEVLLLFILLFVLKLDIVSLNITLFSTIVLLKLVYKLCFIPSISDTKSPLNSVRSRGFY